MCTFIRVLFSPVYPVLSYISLSYKPCTYFLVWEIFFCSPGKLFFKLWNFNVTESAASPPATAEMQAATAPTQRRYSAIDLHRTYFLVLEIFHIFPCLRNLFWSPGKLFFKLWNFNVTESAALPAATAQLQAATAPTQRRYSAIDLQRSYGADGTFVRCNAATAPTKRSYGANDLQRR